MSQKHLKYAFIPFMLFLLISVTCIAPIVYADVIEETNVTTIRIAYGNGIDDNHDGVIDDLNESDVQYGDIDIDTEESTFDEWPSVISHRINGVWYNKTLEQGVKMGAVFESEGKIFPTNTSISPGYECWATQPMTPLEGDDTWENTSYSYGTDIATREILPIMKYYITLSPGDVMNGVQELWHRSPIKWDDNIFHETRETDDNGNVITYPEHFINIYRVTNLLDPDNNTQELVFANSLNNKGHVVVNNRIYTHINAYLTSNVTYAVYEYVGMKNNDPLINFTMYFAPYQDICNDDITTTIVFPNTTQEQSLADRYGNTIEPSYGIQCIIGIGRVGSEKLVMLEENQETRIFTQSIPGLIPILPANGSINSLQVIIPMRMTTPLNMNLTLWIKSGEDVTTAYSDPLEGITGTIIYTFNFTDPNITQQNFYKIRINISKTGKDDTNYCTYLMSPNIEHSHWILKNFTDITGGYAMENTFPCGFGVHVEITELETGNNEDESIVWLDWLIGINLIVIGAFMDVFLWPVSIITFMTYGQTIGTYFITQGLSYIDSDELKIFWNNVLDGLARFRTVIIDGLEWVGEKLWNIALTVVETLIHVGEEIAYYGGLILEGIASIIYFAIFIFSCLMFAYFYRILWAIGNLDWALLTVTGKEATGFLAQIYGKIAGGAKKTTKIISKGGK